MLTQAKREVNSINRKSIFNIGGMLLSFLAVGSLWFFFDFHSWTSHAGITIFLLAIAASTWMLYRGHMLIAKNDFTTHPNEFLANLKLYQLNRFNLYNKLYWVFALALSLGIVLYFIEILAYFDTWLQCLVIVFTFSWMVFCSTLVRRSVMKREKERIALLIEKFERLSKQFKTPL